MRMSRRMGLYSNTKKRVRYHSTLSAGQPRTYIAAATIPNKYVLFAGGYINAATDSALVYACDKLLTLKQVDELQVGRHYMRGADNGTYAFFFAGEDTSDDSFCVDAYDEFLTHSILPSLKYCAGANCSAAMAGTNMIIVGRNYTGEYYTDTLSLGTLSDTFDDKMVCAAATKAGNSAIFAGGTYNTNAYAFSSSLTKSKLTAPTYTSTASAAIEFASHGVFSWGQTYTTDLYDIETFSKSTAPGLSTSRSQHGLAITGPLLIAACGCVGGTASGGTNIADMYDDKFSRIGSLALPYNIGYVKCGSIDNIAMLSGNITNTSVSDLPICVVKYS